LILLAEKYRSTSDAIAAVSFTGRAEAEKGTGMTAARAPASDRVKIPAQPMSIS